MRKAWWHSQEFIQALLRIVAMLFALGVASQSYAMPVPPTASSPTGKSLIQIGVEVVEVDESKSQNLGIQWPGTLNLTENSMPSLLRIGNVERDALTATLQFLEQNGAADVLANPKLVAQDGTAAVFQAGGELPYATSGSLGTVSVEFKKYGVILKISPHVDEQGQIEMSVDAEVSGPDTQNSVTLSGNTVPGIRSRQVTSQLTMEPGTTLTMAGLIQTDKEWTRAGVPGLMHIPLLGYLFSYKTLTNSRTSIVVFVTPTILESASSSTALKPPPPATDDLLTIEERKDMEPSHG